MAVGLRSDDMRIRGACPSQRGRRRWLISGVIAVAALLFLQSHLALDWLGTALIDSQRPSPADLILILGGDFWGPRAMKGAELGKLGYAPIVLISSPPYAGRPEGELAVDFLIRMGYRRQEFAVFPHHATSTIAEAVAVRGELARRHAKSVILVTSEYHSRRAALVFRLFCPGVHFISVPAPDSHYRADDWWRQNSSRQIFLSECVKILGTVAVAYPKYLVDRLTAS